MNLLALFLAFVAGVLLGNEVAYQAYRKIIHDVDTLNKELEKLLDILHGTKDEK